MFCRYLKYLLLIITFTWLSACGFKLYDKPLSSLQLATVYLQSPDPYGTFSIALKQSFKAVGIKLAKNANDAQITLNLININLNHDDPNITASSQATIYNFTYSVVFALQNKFGKSLVGTQAITVSRTLTLNPNEVLEASNEVRIMKGEMERELIMQIFDRLDSNNVRNALNSQGIKP